MKKKIDMVNGKLLPEMLRFAIPIILSSILQTLYNAADSLIVGRYESSYALGAVGSVASIVHILINIFMGLSIGANVIVARYFGAGDKARVKSTSDTAVITAIVSGIIIGILGYFLAEPAARIVKIDEQIIDMSILYMKIFFLGMPFSALYNFIAATLRGIGDTKNPMTSLIISGAVNVVFNIIFVKFFHMGVAGVAWATVISQALAFIMIFVMLKKSEIGFSFKNIKFDNRILKQMSAIGVPSCIQSTTFSLSNTIMISAVNSFGAAAAAGHSVVLQIENILYVAINALTQTVTTFTSQNIGAGKEYRINKIMGLGLLIAIVEGIVLSIVAYMSKDFFIELFAPGDLEAARFALIKYQCIVLPYFVIAFLEIPSGVLRGMGATVTSMIMSILGVCGIRLVWLLILFPIIRTPEFLYISYPVSWVATGFMYMIAYAVLKRKMTTSQPS